MLSDGRILVVYMFCCSTWKWMQPIKYDQYINIYERGVRNGLFMYLKKWIVVRLRSRLQCNDSSETNNLKLGIHSISFILVSDDQCWKWSSSRHNRCQARSEGVNYWLKFFIHIQSRRIPVSFTCVLLLIIQQHSDFFASLIFIG